MAFVKENIIEVSLSLKEVKERSLSLTSSKFLSQFGRKWSNSHFKTVNFIVSFYYLVLHYPLIALYNPKKSIQAIVVVRT